MQPSADLIAAQERLLTLRAAAQAERLAHQAAEVGRETAVTAPMGIQDPACGGGGQPMSWLMLGATRDLARRRGEPSPVLTSEIGPGVTVASSTENERGKGVTAVTPGVVSETIVRNAPSGQQHETHDPAVLIPPQLISHVKNFQQADGKTGIFASFRFLVLFKLDADGGPGWLAMSDILARYATPDTPDFICSRDNLRKAIYAGEGVFWRLEKGKGNGNGNGRLFLLAWHRIAQNLGAASFDRRFASLPRHLATGNIKKFRAAAYAAVLTPTNSPISKSRLVEMTGLSESSLYEYDAILRQERVIEVQRNIALTPDPVGGATEDAQETAWRRANASPAGHQRDTNAIPAHAYSLHDEMGVYGRPGGRYLAWQRPNSYQTAGDVSRRRKQPRHQQCVDPDTIGNRGNGTEKMVRLNFDEYAAAQRQASKTGRPVYLNKPLRAGVGRPFGAWGRVAC